MKPTAEIMTNRVAHPCEGLTKAAFAAFDAIAAGQQPRASERTIAMLMERGLIQRKTRRVHSGDGLPPAEAFSYSVPYEHHIRWCEHWDSPPRRGPAGRRKSKRSVCDGEPELF
jgi:hypothetical protein